MELWDTPTWVWILTIGGVILPVGSLFLIWIYEWKRRKPTKTVTIGETHVELWTREHKMPAMSDAIIVPVAPDLAMVSGVAKWVKDMTANKAQREAAVVAPLEPGDALVTSGARYKFNAAALAVVMDNQKLTRPEWVTRGVSEAIEKLYQAGASKIILADFTDDLRQQPQWPTEADRRRAAEAVVGPMLEGILAAGDRMETIVIWVKVPGVEDIYSSALDRYAASSTAGHSAAHAH